MIHWEGGLFCAETDCPLPPVWPQGRKVMAASPPGMCLEVGTGQGAQGRKAALSVDQPGDPSAEYRRCTTPATHPRAGHSTCPSKPVICVGGRDSQTGRIYLPPKTLFWNKPKRCQHFNFLLSPYTEGTNSFPRPGLSDYNAREGAAVTLEAELPERGTGFKEEGSADNTGPWDRLDVANASCPLQTLFKLWKKLKLLLCISFYLNNHMKIVQKRQGLQSHCSRVS